MDFTTAIESLIEMSFGESGESFAQIEMAQAIINGIIELKEELSSAKNS